MEIRVGVDGGDGGEDARGPDEHCHGESSV